MGLLHGELRFVLQATIDRRGTAPCQQLGRTLTANADGVVPVGRYRGNIFFLSMTDVPASLCNEVNSSMEASALAKAGQFRGLGPV